MATTKQVEAAIKKIEGFRVRLRWPDGHDVRSDYSRLIPYPYDWSASGDWTVQEWIDERFGIWYAGFKVYVYKQKGKPVAGNTKLRNLRR